MELMRCMPFFWYLVKTVPVLKESSKSRLRITTKPSSYAANGRLRISVASQKNQQTPRQNLSCCNWLIRWPTQQMRIVLPTDGRTYGHVVEQIDRHTDGRKKREGKRKIKQ